MRRILVLLLGLAAIAALVVGIQRHRATEPVSPYRLAAIEQGDLESTVSATGALSAVSMVQIGTQVSGQIAELHADFNDRVVKGQLLARLDATLLEQALRQAGAERDRADADLALKKSALGRAKSLHADGLIDEDSFQTSLANETMARANLRSAHAAYDKAAQNLKYTAIYAPIDGIVIERNVDVGQTVAASLSAPQLFLVAEDLSRMQILVAVDESDIGQVQDGQSASFTVQAYPDRTFSGSVRQKRLQSKTIDSVVNYIVVVEVANEDGKLLSGMTATVVFEVARASNVFKVANAAIRFRPTDAMREELSARREASGDADGEPGEGRGEGGRSRQPDEPGGSVGSRESGGERGPGTGGERGPGGPGGRGRGRRPDVAMLWLVDAAGQLDAIRVHLGITDGQLTEIRGDGIEAGMSVIAGVVTTEAASGSAASPFQPQQQPQGRGPRGGGF